MDQRLHTGAGQQAIGLGKGFIHENFVRLAGAGQPAPPQRHPVKPIAASLVDCVEQGAHRLHPPRHVQRGIVLDAAFGVLHPRNGGDAGHDITRRPYQPGKHIGKAIAGVIGIAGLHQRRMDPLAHDEGGGGGRKHQRDSQRLPAQPHQIAQQLDVQRRHQLICAG